MPYFYVLNGRHRHKVFHLGDKPEGDIIGQRDDAGVHLRDPWISWTHAKVVREGGRILLEDLGSTNGTYVNCEKITTHPLAEDDVVFLGRTHLLFVASSRAPSAPPRGAAQAAAAAVVAGEGTMRIVVPGVRQDLPALDVSQESRLMSSSSSGDGRAAAPGAPPRSRGGEEESTDSVRSPFRDAGRIDELDFGDEDGIPLPPDAELAYVRPLESDEHFEIDIAELGLSPLSPGSRDAVGEAVRVHSIDGVGSDEDVESFEPRDPRDGEIARLRAALAARDEEVLRLRAELTKLKEQYLDL